jgi:feruloyl-CoA synthase
VEIKLAPVGSKLEVRARGDCITPGYFKDEAKTKTAFDEEGFYCLGDGAKFVDDRDISKGIIFDGRIAEDFKLSSGTWVNAGRLRVNVIDACDGLLSDCVIAGLDREYIAVLGFLDLAVAGEIVGKGASLADALESAPLREKLAALLRAYNEKNKGSSTRVKRLLLQPTPPSADKSEITDKGYINQGAVLSARASDVARLYAAEPDAQVIVV